MRSGARKKWLKETGKGQEYLSRTDPIREKKGRRKRKLEVIEAYGGECACCGETNPVLLTIDHIHNNGKEHRKEMSGGDQLYIWLKKEGFPTAEYQLLCYSCNIGKHRNGGVCPHLDDGEKWLSAA